MTRIGLQVGFALAQLAPIFWFSLFSTGISWKGAIPARGIPSLATQSLKISPNTRCWECVGNARSSTGRLRRITSGLRDSTPGHDTDLCFLSYQPIGQIAGRSLRGEGGGRWVGFCWINPLGGLWFQESSRPSQPRPRRQAMIPRGGDLGLKLGLGTVSGRHQTGGERPTLNMATAVI